MIRLLLFTTLPTYLLACAATQPTPVPTTTPLPPVSTTTTSIETTTTVSTTMPTDTTTTTEDMTTTTATTTEMTTTTELTTTTEMTTTTEATTTTTENSVCGSCKADMFMLLTGNPMKIEMTDGDGCLSLVVVCPAPTGSVFLQFNTGQGLLNMPGETEVRVDVTCMGDQWMYQDTPVMTVECIG